ncbi:MAG: hypothetical protein H6578_10185 [Chitinophagales bacterium]|nr:hypothetical protein [Chitinophagales bacterium]
MQNQVGYYIKNSVKKYHPFGNEAFIGAAATLHFNFLGTILPQSIEEGTKP